MKGATILVADNNEDFCESIRWFLEHEGFRVVVAHDPSEAKRVLERGNIDLAILDIRMSNDSDEKDVSGLMLAKEVAPRVPKIVLTQFPTVEAVKEALSPRGIELPAAVDFLSKSEGPQALLRSVQRALSLEDRRAGS